MQVYNLDIQNNFGKVNPADHLSQQSLNDAVRQKNKVRFENDAFVQRIRILENASDQRTQQVLSKVISGNQFRPSQGSTPVQAQFSVN